MKRNLLLLLLFVGCVTMKAQDYRLWYDKPAMTWTQALPVGNGVVGGMVFGQPAVEHIQLNEETIWAGQPNNVVNPEAKKYLPQVQQLILEGKYQCCGTKHGNALSALRRSLSINGWTCRLSGL